MLFMAYISLQTFSNLSPYGAAKRQSHLVNDVVNDIIDGPTAAHVPAAGLGHPRLQIAIRQYPVCRLG
jgi:hypothetical protein